MSEISFSVSRGRIMLYNAGCIVDILLLNRKKFAAYAQQNRNKQYIPVPGYHIILEVTNREKYDSKCLQALLDWFDKHRLSDPKLHKLYKKFRVIN